MDERTAKSSSLTQEPMRIPVFERRSHPIHERRGIGSPWEQQVNIARLVGSREEVVELPQADFFIAFPTKMFI
nr:hypothetical protein [Flavisolibacter nicotianae]